MAHAQCSSLGTGGQHLRLEHPLIRMNLRDRNTIIEISETYPTNFSSSNLIAGRNIILNGILNGVATNFSKLTDDPELSYKIDQGPETPYRFNLGLLTGAAQLEDFQPEAVN